MKAAAATRSLTEWAGVISGVDAGVTSGVDAGGVSSAGTCGAGDTGVVAESGTEGVVVLVSVPTSVAAWWGEPVPLGGGGGVCNGGAVTVSESVLCKSP